MLGKTCNIDECWNVGQNFAIAAFEETLHNWGISGVWGILQFWENMQACCICECWENVPRAWPPAPRTKVFRSRCCTAPQLHGRAGLGRTAPGTSYKGISFRVLRCPAGVGCTAPRTSYTAAFPFKVCAAPQIHRPAGLGCTATGLHTKARPLGFARAHSFAAPQA